MSMKWKRTVLVIFLMTLFCGCAGTSGTPSAKPSSSAAESSEQSTETVSETGPKVIESSFGRADGALGDTMKTAFLEFTLNNAYLTSDYQGIKPDQGMKLLVLNITTKSTQSTDLTLYDTDYQVQWGGTGEEDYSTPLTYRDEWATAPTYKRNVSLEGVQGMFPGTVVLKKEETNTADFVYQVPEDRKEFKLEFKEFFADESLGDFYCVKFSPQEQS